MSDSSGFSLILLEADDAARYISGVGTKNGILKSTHGITERDSFKTQCGEILDQLDSPDFMRFLSEERFTSREVQDVNGNLKIVHEYRIASPEEWDQWDDGPDNGPRDYGNVEEYTVIEPSEMSKVLAELQKVWNYMSYDEEEDGETTDSFEFYENLNDSPMGEEFFLTAIFSIKTLFEYAEKEGLAAIYINERFCHLVKI